MRSKKGGLPPVSDLDPDYLQWQATKNIRDSFWCPTNNHNRLLNSFTPKEKFFLRDYERYPVSAPGTSRRPPFAQEPHADYPVWQDERASAARRSQSARKPTVRVSITVDENGVATTGGEGVNVSLTVEGGKKSMGQLLAQSADLGIDVRSKRELKEAGRDPQRISVDMATGRKLTHKEAVAIIKDKEEAWRLARAVTHVVPEEYDGTRPYSQTYNHYKYHGFAGQGAKTSYAKRDGLTAKGKDETFKRTVQVTASTASLRKSKKERKESESTVRAVEADLVTGKRIDDLTMELSKTQKKKAGDVKEGGEGGDKPEDILIEAWRRANVTTVKAPARYEGTRPYSETYDFYKYYGYAGHGAKTSWAKNPRFDQLKLMEE